MECISIIYYHEQRDVTNPPITKDDIEMIKDKEKLIEDVKEVKNLIKLFEIR